MINDYSNFYSMADRANKEYTVIPKSGEESYVNGLNENNGKNVRELAKLEEVHDLMIVASSNKSEIDPNWKAIVDVYIKDLRSADPQSGNEIEYHLYDSIVLKDRGRYYNEKTFSLLPLQELCYKIEYASSLTQNNSNIQVSCSCLEFSDVASDYYKAEIIACDSNNNPIPATIFMEYSKTSSTSGYIFIPDGGTVKYTVSCKHYVTKTGNFRVSGGDVTKTIKLDNMKYLRVNSDTPNVTIQLTCSGYVQEGNEIWVPSGKTVNYRVSAPHYVTQTGSWTFSGNNDHDEIKLVNLNLQTHTLTVNSDQPESTIKLEAEGYTQQGNSITVPYKTKVTYRVYKKDYITETGTVSVEQNTTINVHMRLKPGTVLMEKNMYGNYSIQLQPGKYEIIVVGGGGGSAGSGGGGKGYSPGWYDYGQGGS